MKTAIYIEDGVTQLVITPENEFEQNALKIFQGDEMTAEIFNGSFYNCRGGWVRQSAYQTGSSGLTVNNGNDSSLILKASTPLDEKAQ